MTRRRRSNKIEEAMIDLAVVLAVAVLFRKSWSWWVWCGWSGGKRWQASGNEQLPNLVFYTPHFHQIQRCWGDATWQFIAARFCRCWFQRAIRPDTATSIELKRPLRHHSLRGLFQLAPVVTAHGENITNRQQIELHSMRTAGLSR